MRKHKKTETYTRLDKDEWIFIGFAFIALLLSFGMSNPIPESLYSDIFLRSVSAATLVCIGIMIYMYLTKGKRS